jgi:hypothetical protein
LSYKPILLFVATTRFELVYEAYETSELTTTLNRNVVGSERFESSFGVQAFHHFIRNEAFSSVELRANICATFRLELNTIFL